MFPSDEAVALDRGEDPVEVAARRVEQAFGANFAQGFAKDVSVVAGPGQLGARAAAAFVRAPACEAVDVVEGRPAVARSSGRIGK